MRKNFLHVHHQSMLGTNFLLIPYSVFFQFISVGQTVFWSIIMSSIGIPVVVNAYKRGIITKDALVDLVVASVPIAEPNVPSGQTAPSSNASAPSQSSSLNQSAPSSSASSTGKRKESEPSSPPSSSQKSKKSRLQKPPKGQQSIFNFVKCTVKLSSGASLVIPKDARVQPASRPPAYVCSAPGCGRTFGVSPAFALSTATTCLSGMIIHIVVLAAFLVILMCLHVSVPPSIFFLSFFLSFFVFFSTSLRSFLMRKLMACC